MHASVVHGFFTLMLHSTAVCCAVRTALSGVTTNPDLSCKFLQYLDLEPNQADSTRGRHNERRLETVSQITQPSYPIPRFQANDPQPRSQHRHRLRQRTRLTPSLPLLPGQTGDTTTIIQRRGHQQAEHVATQRDTARRDVADVERRVERHDCRRRDCQYGDGAASPAR